MPAETISAAASEPNVHKESSRTQNSNNNNLGNLQNSVNHEMTKVMDWLTANKLSLNISETKYTLITNKHVNSESFVINLNRNRIERTMTYKYLGVIVDEKLTWKEHCKQLCSTMSKYVGVMYKSETLCE